MTKIALMFWLQLYFLLGPCPSRGALVSRVGSLSHVMLSDGSAYFLFSTDHLGIIDIFGHHGNILATMVTDISLSPLFFNNSYSNPMPKKAKENTRLALCCTFFGCYGNILVSMVTNILWYLFPSSYNHPYATSMPKWPLLATVAMVTES